MDPITLAVTGALANRDQDMVEDAYSALKAALKKKYGPKSDLVEALEKLEGEPESGAWQALFQQKVAGSRADQNLDLLVHASAVIQQLKGAPGDRGNRGSLTGQGEVPGKE